MQIALRVYPDELIEYVVGPKYQESDIFPRMDIPDAFFEEMLYVIKEILLCSKLEANKNGKKQYSLIFPLNPFHYYKRINDVIDPINFPWYSLWKDRPLEVVKEDRKSVIQFLEQNHTITVVYNPPQNPLFGEYYAITIEAYPNYKALQDLEWEIEDYWNMIQSQMEENIQREKKELEEAKKSIIYRAIEKSMREAEMKRKSSVYYINFMMSGEIILNNFYIISKPHFDTENDLFFEFVYKRPRQKIMIDEIEKEMGKLQNDLSKIVYNLGFKGELKKLFFPRIGNKSILFNNNITPDDLKSLNIDTVALDKQIKSLPTR